MSESTTIRIKKSTKDKLDAIGHKGQSYDDIIKELCEFYETEKDFFRH